MVCIFSQRHAQFNTSQHFITRYHLCHTFLYIKKSHRLGISGIKYLPKSLNRFGIKISFARTSKANKNA